MSDTHPAYKPSAMIFIVSGVALRRDGKYLLVQERKDQVYGKWNLPAGRVDEGETLEEAAVREAREECGYEVRLGLHLITLHQAVDRPVLHAYAAKIIGGELRFPEDEILDARWFTYEEVLAMKDSLRNPAYIIGAIEADQAL